MSEKEKLGPIFDQKGHIRYTSVSQLQTAERCLRRWYYEKVEGHREPETPAQARGTALHSEWQKHFVNDEALGPLAMAGIELKPGFLFTSEEPTHRIDDKGFIDALVKVDGVPLVGYIDICARNAVWDIKTTSDKKYAKTPDQLAGNLQMLGYAMHAWELFGHREPMTIAHWYFLTRGKPKSWVVETVVEPEQAFAEWAKATPIMRTIREAASLGPGRADDVACNTDACDDYRGCYHRSRCSAGSSDLLAKMFGADEASLLINPNPETDPNMSTPFFKAPPDQLSPEAQASLARFRGGATDTQALEAAQVGFLIDLIDTANYGTPPLDGSLAFALCRYRKAPEVPHVDGTRAMQTLDRPVESIDDLRELADSLGLGPKLAGMPTAAQASALELPATVADLPNPAAVAFEAPAEPGVLPPDAPPQSEKKRGRPPKQKPAAVEAEAPRDPVVEAHAAEPAQALPQRSFIVASVDPSRVDEAARARAYPTPPAAFAEGTAQTKAVSEHVGMIAPLPVVLQSGPAPTSPARADATTIEAPEPAGLDLYIDCLPATGEQPKPLYEYVDKCMSALAKMAKVDDVRLVDKSSPLAYGNWRAALQAVVVRQPPPAGRWFIDTRGSEPNEVVALALLAKAHTVVRGLR